MLWLPNYEKVVVSSKNRDGSPKIGDKPRHPESPPRIVLHTTEGLRTYDYPWPPHFTLGLVGDPHSLPAGSYWFPGGNRRLYDGQELRLQHCDLSLTSYALLHRDGDPDTNHRGSHCVQVEIISMAASPPHWSDDMYRLVASWLADVVKALPELRPALDNWPPASMWSERGSWGFNTPFRMSWETWAKGIGGKPMLCAHEHVPGNDHWDTGALDVVRLTNLAKSLLEPPGPTWRQKTDARLVKLERAVFGG